ncbi:MAG: hypothetical protein IH623_24820 [Verrucomicrobia bacterium]|nr:hypothetical protein [Verrucomicrobiota bacterium]
MTTLALVLRLVSVAGWALLILGGLVLDGFQIGVLPMVGLLALSLTPHSLLLRSRIVFIVVLAISFLPLLRLAYMIFTMKSVGMESPGYKMWLATGLIIATLLVALLPVSLLLSFVSARRAQRA